MDPTAPLSHTFHPSATATSATNAAGGIVTAPAAMPATATSQNAASTADAANPLDVAQIIRAAQLMSSMAADGGSSVVNTAELEQLVTAALFKKSDPPTSPRKKTKPKSSASQSVAAAAATNHLSIDNHVVQKHLDAWLDGCLKDAQPLTSASSEFLDNNFPSLNHNGGTTSTTTDHQPPRGPTMLNNHQQHHNNGSTSSSNPTTNNHTQHLQYGNNPTSASAAQAAAFYLNSGGAGAFGAPPPKPSDTPTRNSGGSGGGMHDPFNAGYQRYFPMYPPNFGGSGAVNGNHMASYLNGGMANMGLMGSRQSNMNSDFSSLPPAVNMMNHGKDLRIDAQDILDGLDHRHFSDPCLAGASDDSKDSGNGPNGRSSNSTKNNDSTKMLSTILEQIGVLHETNTKICRSLHDNKVDIEALKHAPSWGGMRNRRDSISGLSTHSQPLGYAFGTHSPAPTFHSGIYTPGMLTDVVREVKDAARVREDALLSRVKAMVEERSWMINDTNVKLMRELEDMKTQINNLKSERHDTKSQINKMEDEIKSLRTLLTHFLQATTSSANTPPRPSSSGYHHPLQNSQSFNERDYSGGRPNRTANRSTLNLHYGTISNHEDTDLGFPTEDDIILPMNQQFNDIRKAEKLKYSQSNGKHSRESSEHHEATTSDGHIVQMEKDTLELRRELQDALAGKKQAENKVLTLENIVLKLQNGVAIHESESSAHNTHPNHSRNSSFSEGPAHTSSSSSTVITGGGKSQQQQQQQHYHSTPNNSKQGSSVGLTGPVTDL